MFKPFCLSELVLAFVSKYLYTHTPWKKKIEHFCQSMEYILVVFF